MGKRAIPSDPFENWNYFRHLEPTWLPLHEGQWVAVSSCQHIGFFATQDQAIDAGLLKKWKRRSGRMGIYCVGEPQEKVSFSEFGGAVLGPMLDGSSLATANDDSLAPQVPPHSRSAPTIQHTTRNQLTMAKRKSVKKSSPKSNSKTPPAPAYPGNPRPINTGKGSSAEQIGKQLIASFNAGKWELNSKLWSKDLVGIEGGGMLWKGYKNVQLKNKFWSKGNTPLGGHAEGPYVGATGFSVKFRMDIKDNSTGRRTIMEEIGVYTVLNGMIIQEEFMYGSMTPAEAAHP